MESKVQSVARAIWSKRPDCAGKPFPPDTWDDKARRAYPHNPIAALDLCFIYARAALEDLRNPTKDMLEAMYREHWDGIVDAALKEDAG